MRISLPPPKLGPYDGQLNMEKRSELYFPVWDSFTGAQAGLLTNENKKAFELYRYLQLETNKQMEKKSHKLFR